MHLETNNIGGELCKSLNIPPEGVKEITIHYRFCDIMRVEVTRETPLLKTDKDSLIKMFESYEINPKLVKQIRIGHNVNSAASLES